MGVFQKPHEQPAFHKVFHSPGRRDPALSQPQREDTLYISLTLLPLHELGLGSDSMLHHLSSLSLAQLSQSLENQGISIGIRLTFHQRLL
jgi:hypothetical protein